MSFNYSAQYLKPDNARKRAQELISMGYKQKALELLYPVVTHRRNRVWSKPNEKLIMLFLDICVELRQSDLAKEALYQFKVISLQVPNSMELVVKFFLQRAREATREAQLKAAAAGLDENVVNELESLNDGSCNPLLMVSGENSKERGDRIVDRELVNPWLRFLWSVYRSVLDSLHKIQKLETLYKQTAIQAFQFCLENGRSYEFRRLNDLLRLHMKYHQHQLLDHPQSFQTLFEVRLVQLNTAITLELWQEAFKIVEDVEFMLKDANRSPPPAMLMVFFEYLTRIFWVSENYGLHAISMLRYYELKQSLGPKSNQPQGESHQLEVDDLLLSAPTQMATQEGRTPTASDIVDIVISADPTTCSAPARPSSDPIDLASQVLLAVLSMPLTSDSPRMTSWVDLVYKHHIPVSARAFELSYDRKRMLQNASGINQCYVNSCSSSSANLPTSDLTCSSFIAHHSAQASLGNMKIPILPIPTSNVCTFCSSLSSTNGNVFNGLFSESADFASERMSRLAAMLDATDCNRSVLLQSIMNSPAILANIPPELQQLYNELESGFAPHSLGSYVAQNLARIQLNPSLRQYVKTLAQLGFVRVFQQLSTIYRTLHFDNISTYLPFVSKSALAQWTVRAIHLHHINAVLDDRTQTLLFEHAADSAVLDVSLARNRLASVAYALSHIARVTIPLSHQKAAQFAEREKMKELELKNQVMVVKEEHASLLVRRQLVDQVLIARESQLEAERCAQAEQEKAARERSEKLESERIKNKALAAEAKRESARLLELERAQKKSLLNKLQEQAQKTGTKLNQTLNQKLEQGIVDTNVYIDNQVRTIVNEHDKQERHLRDIFERMDYLTRARRQCEFPILKTVQAKIISDSEEQFSNRAIEYAESHKLLFNQYLSLRSQLAQTQPHRLTFEEKIRQKLKATWEAAQAKAKEELELRDKQWREEEAASTRQVTGQRSHHHASRGAAPIGESGSNGGITRYNREPAAPSRTDGEWVRHGPPASAQAQAPSLVTLPQQEPKLSSWFLRIQENNMQKASQVRLPRVELPPYVPPSATREIFRTQQTAPPAVAQTIPKAVSSDSSARSDIPAQIQPSVPTSTVANGKMHVSPPIMVQPGQIPPPEAALDPSNLPLSADSFSINDQSKTYLPLRVATGSERANSWTSRIPIQSAAALPRDSRLPPSTILNTIAHPVNSERSWSANKQSPTTNLQPEEKARWTRGGSSQTVHTTDQPSSSGSSTQPQYDQEVQSSSHFDSRRRMPRSSGDRNSSDTPISGPRFRQGDSFGRRLPPSDSLVNQGTASSLGSIPKAENWRKSQGSSTSASNLTFSHDRGNRSDRGNFNMQNYQHRPTSNDSQRRYGQPAELGHGKFNSNILNERPGRVDEQSSWRSQPQTGNANNVRPSKD